MRFLFGGGVPGRQGSWILDDTSCICYSLLCHIFAARSCGLPYSLCHLAPEVTTWVDVYGAQIAPL